MKNAKTVNFLQLDHKVSNLVAEPGVIVLPSPQAFKKLSWTRRHFGRKPVEGYFVWIKKQVNHPLSTCITLASKGTSQKPTNLVVLEKGLKIEIRGVCNAVKQNLFGSHDGNSIIILKENSQLKISHFHSWGKKDEVKADLKFILEKKSKLVYSFKCLRPPMKLQAKTEVYLKEGSSANSNIAFLAKDSQAEINEAFYLKGKDANSVSRLKIVADHSSTIEANSKMVAEAESNGHVDCMGLLLNDNSCITAIPQLINKNKKASLTHEASVGRIAEENLNYLRSRGLTEDEAIDLIISGFLGENEPLTIKGATVSSRENM